ncbi:twin-arginine translocase TatA/TatE family subunit [bacterium]|nr:twin-arginine translocase TatA/TatE family subunit [bacterium]
MFAAIGQMEIILIVLAILLLFGGRKIPELARGLGSGIREFQQGMRGEAKGDAKGQGQTPAKSGKPDDDAPKDSA